MKAQDVAKYIINRAIDFGKPLSNLPLQKILYFVHIGYLKENKKKLITDEKFEAWQWGPVIREVYVEYSIFGSNKLVVRYEDLHLDLNEDERKLIDDIIEESVDLFPWELVRRSHIKGGAWDKVYKDGKGDKQIIPDAFIEQEALTDAR